MESFSLFPRILYFTFISDTEKRRKEKMSLKDGKLKKFASSKLRRSASQTDGRAKRSLQVEKFPPFFSSLFTNKPCRTASWWAGAPSPSPTWWTWWEPPGKMGRRRIVTREFLFSAQAPGLVLLSSRKYHQYNLNNEYIDDIQFSTVNVNARTIFWGKFDTVSFTDWF